MKVFRYPSGLKIKRSSLILGAFEVIHNGHLELIKRAKSYKDPVVIMLIEDPSLLPKSKLMPATSLSVRLAQLANLDIEYAIVVNIGNELITTGGYDFVTNMIKTCTAKRIILGKDFKTGHNASYDTQAIKRDFQNTIIVDFVKFNNAKVSTTLVKEILETGDVATVKKIAPFPFQREMHFDENNQATGKFYSAIHPGIYACFCELNDVIYWSALHVNIENNATIYAPDLMIKKQPFKAKVWFHKKIRTIVKLAHDKITNDDKKMAAAYLNTI